MRQDGNSRSIQRDAQGEQIDFIPGTPLAQIRNVFCTPNSAPVPDPKGRARFSTPLPIGACVQLEDGRGPNRASVGLGLPRAPGRTGQPHGEAGSGRILTDPQTEPDAARRSNADHRRCAALRCVGRAR